MLQLGIGDYHCCIKVELTQNAPLRFLLMGSDTMRNPVFISSAGEEDSAGKEDPAGKKDSKQAYMVSKSEGHRYCPLDNGDKIIFPNNSVGELCKSLLTPNCNVF